METANLSRMLKAVLSVMPIDTPESNPAVGLEVIGEPETIVQAHVVVPDQLGKKIQLVRIERFAFYERAKKAFAVIATGEPLFYGDVILSKGSVDLSNS